MTNFLFLQQDWPTLFNKAKKAEERVNLEPVSSAIYCRLILEESIHLIFEYEFVDLPYNKTLDNLMREEVITSNLSQYIQGLHIVRKIGNNASHYGKRVSKDDALNSIKHLYGYLKWFANNYAENPIEVPSLFNHSFLVELGSTNREIKAIQEEAKQEVERLNLIIEKREKERATLLEKAKESDDTLRQLQEQLEQGRLAIKQQKEERLLAIPLEFTEEETRDQLIDVALKEAGWFNLQKRHDVEYPVKGMPITSDNPKGNGFADYVLWDISGKPLAVIEAKRTKIDVDAGRHQAILYANCLEHMHGQRPIIFYTNGYEIKILDDVFYSAPRQIHGFYTKDELIWLIQQRDKRKDIRLVNPNPDIAGRAYQIEAIKRVSEAFVTDSSEGGLKGNKRDALLVMATGTGKTRTAAALVDNLFTNGWVKRVLFLADRNALVSQAKRNFGELLPNLTASVVGKDKTHAGVRIEFSTYQSMIKRIDNVQNKDGGRQYGVGHFDLIIIDEAHRSVYNKYKSIFEYFDALLIGLTATPKGSIDHNTYELFGCSNEDPTFNFGLEEATPTFLNPYKNYDISTEFIREGIKYKNLSEEEKKKYEETFRDNATGLFPEEIQSSQMNKKLFNTDTVNKVLDALMENGLKIEGGDKLGKTIIFAMNHAHAKFIVECFEKRYPELPSGFIAMIHNKVSHSQSLIDSFCNPESGNNPQIAVSVDMMDTGIDAPRILNLVFFKVVRSYAKFWQMIGRGTRLCPDIFGSGQHKKEFLIFDVCKNFEFFSVNKNGKENSVQKTMTQQIFESRLQLSRLLFETGEEKNVELAKKIVDLLHASIDNLSKDRFQVVMEEKFVDIYSERQKWDNLSSEDINIIETHLSKLVEPEKTNESARRFDLMMLKLQLASQLKLKSEKGFQERLMNVASELSKKYSLNDVYQSKELIENLKDPNFYSNLSQKKLSEIREEIRELVYCLKQDEIKAVYSNIIDSEIEVEEGPIIYSNMESGMYKRRVESFIRQNKHNLTISKLNTNLPITSEELKMLEDILFDGNERGHKSDFIETYGEQPLGVFIRSIIGLKKESAEEAFSTFLQSGNLSANQTRFIQQIINYLSKNGTIDKEMLFQSPFTDINDQGIFGVFEEQVDQHKVINIIDLINANAEIG